MTRKILLFHYFGGAGGKFITNCLSYSKKVAFSNYKNALAILSNNDLTLIQQLLLDTIPDKAQSRQWLFLEKGCSQLFGTAITDIKKNKFSAESQFNDLDALGNVWLPVVSHNMNELKAFTSFFADCEIFTVYVDSTVEFIDLAIRLKWPEIHHCIDLDQYKKFKEEVILTNFDFYFNNWNPLAKENHTMITDLANNIGINFDIIVCEKYIEKYINFHI